MTDLAQVRQALEKPILRKNPSWPRVNTAIIGCEELRELLDLAIQDIFALETARRTALAALGAQPRTDCRMGYYRYGPCETCGADATGDCRMWRVV